MNKEKIDIHDLAKQMSEAISTERERRYIENEAKLEAVLRANGWRKQSEGEWEKFEGERFICSNCAKVFGLGSTSTIHDVKRGWKYCPNCGAKMHKKTEIKDYPPYLDRPKMEGGAE